MIFYYTKEDYSNAYVEVLEILKYISKEDFDKIPKEIIELFYKNQNVNYEFQYDFDKSFEEQQISRLTQSIIASLYIKYWAIDEEKIEYKEKSEKFFVEEEKRKSQKYNPKDLFPKEEIDDEGKKELVVVEKESFIIKLVKKIKKNLKKMSKTIDKK